MSDFFVNLNLPGLEHTAWLLKTGNLCVHPSVERVVLHGSRGIKNSYTKNSDLDLSLLLSIETDVSEALFRCIYEYTMEKWLGTVKLDLAIIFDISNCHLACFDNNIYSPQLCSKGKDCFGIAKFDQGYNGIIRNPGIEVEKMYPCVIVHDKRIHVTAV